MPDTEKTLFDKVKSALRVKSGAFDGEIRGLIEACKADLRRSGVTIPSDHAAPVEGKETSTGDSLVDEAITIYAKGHFGLFEGGAVYRELYEFKKRALCLGGGGAALG